MEIGAQLYTVREACSTLEGFAETLKKVADIGYRTVQVSGTCAYEPEWLEKELKKNDLRCVITHIPGDRISDETQQVIEAHQTFDCQYIGLGGYAFEDLPYEGFLEKYLPAAKAFRQAGKLFMYHNHDREFIRQGDKIVMEKLMEDIPADLMGFTLDTF